MSTTIRLPRARDRSEDAAADRGLGRSMFGAQKPRRRLPDLDAVIGLVTAPPFLGWATARIAIFGALAFSRYLVNHLGAADPTGRPPSGLMGWDAVWYLRIVKSGYSHLPWESMRFFPLLAVIGRVLRPLFGARMAVLIPVNVAALASGFLLARLARREKGDEAVAARAGWLFALLPPAFVLAMGYAEALFVLCAIATFLALRSQRFAWAIVGGLLAGLSRPLGMLVALPAAVEGLRGWRRANRTERMTRLAAVASPLVGMLAYLTWSLVEYGDFLRPFTVQQAFDRRGGFENPLVRLVEAGRQLTGGAELGSGLHLPWAIGFLFLLIVLFRKWPVSYGLFAAAILVTALSAENLDSLERYGLSAFPLVLALAEVVRAPWLEKTTLALCGAGLTVYATLAFLGAYVP